MRRLTLLAAALAIAFPLAAGAANNTLPADVAVTGQIQQTLDSKTTTDGTPFTIAIVPPYANPMLKGAVVYGHVSDVQKAGQGTEPHMTLVFDRLVLSSGKSRQIHAQLLKEAVIEDKSGKAVNAVAKGVATVVSPAHGMGLRLLSKNHKDDVHVPAQSEIVIELTQSVQL